MMCLSLAIEVLLQTVEPEVLAGKQQRKLAFLLYFRLRRVEEAGSEWLKCPCVFSVATCTLSVLPFPRVSKQGKKSLMRISELTFICAASQPKNLRIFLEFSFPLAPCVPLVSISYPLYPHNISTCCHVLPPLLRTSLLPCLAWRTLLAFLFPLLLPLDC